MRLTESIYLLDRLANYATRSPELLPKNIDIFEVFFKHTAKIIEVSTKKMSSSPYPLLNIAI